MRGNEKEGEWTYWERDGKRWLNFNYGDGLERVKLGEIEERDGMTYKIGKYKPYSGIVEEFDLKILKSYLFNTFIF